MTDFSGLYQKYAPEVFRFALYLSGNRADAEDITSTTFVRVWTSPEPVRMATVRGYLMTIARNLFLQGMRRKSRQTDLPEDLRDTAPGPHDTTGTKLELEATLTAMQKLPEIDRAALLMRALEEMPYDEIARALNLSVSAARVRVHRARRTLMNLRDTPTPPGSAPDPGARTADTGRPSSEPDAGTPKAKAGPSLKERKEQ